MLLDRPISAFRELDVHEFEFVSGGDDYGEIVVYGDIGDNWFDGFVENPGENYDPGDVFQENVGSSAGPQAPSASDFHVTGDTASVNTALQYLNNSPTFRALAEWAKTHNVTIVVGTGISDHYDPRTNTVYWNPTSAIQLQDNAHNNLGLYQSAAIGLAHELAHAYFFNELSYTYGLGMSPNANYLDMPEYIVGTMFETPIANELGEPARSNDNGQDYTESGPTSHDGP